MRKCFIHWYGRIPEAAHSSFIAHGSVKCFSQTDAHILHCVMGIHMEITACIHGKIEKTMLGEELKHVVHEAYPSVDFGVPGPINVQLQFDLCFSRFTCDFNFPSHNKPSLQF
jgi:hypothetical protein